MQYPQEENPKTEEENRFAPAVSPGPAEEEALMEEEAPAREEAPAQEEAPARENVLAGVVGSVLFSLAGVALWFLLNQIGFVAGLAGLVTLICAVQGYVFFSKAKNSRALLVGCIVTALMILVAEYLCLSYEVYQAYQLWHAEGEIGYTLTFFESVSNAYLFLSEWDILSAYLIELGIGYALSIVGCLSYVRNFKKTAQAN